MSKEEYAALLKEVVRHLFPDIEEYDEDEWRYGTNNSWQFSFTGEYAGYWRHHETEEGGNVFSLIIYLVDGVSDYKQAKAWLNDLRNGAPIVVKEDKEAQARAEKKAADRIEAVEILAKNRRRPPEFVRQFFVNRGTWPDKDEDLGWEKPLPANVFWVPVNSETARYFKKVPGAAGSVMVPLQTPGRKADALELSYPLNKQGNLIFDKDGNRWRRQRGRHAKACASKVFILSRPPVKTVVMVEGMADALAIHKLEIPNLEVRAVLGIGKMGKVELCQTEHPTGLVLVPDAEIENTCREKLEELFVSQIEKDRNTSIINAATGDPDTWLTEWTGVHANRRFSELSKYEDYDHTDATAYLLQEAADQEAERNAIPIH